MLGGGEEKKNCRHASLLACLFCWLDLAGQVLSWNRGNLNFLMTYGLTVQLHWGVCFAVFVLFRENNHDLAQTTCFHAAIPEGEGPTSCEKLPVHNSTNTPESVPSVVTQPAVADLAALSACNDTTPINLQLLLWKVTNMHIMWTWYATIGTTVSLGCICGLQKH